jgi:SAM-dependent methyltransferase
LSHPKTAIERLVYGYGGKLRLCPICDRTSRRFAPHGRPSRPEARCVWCSSLERHRLVWLYLQKEGHLFDGRSRAVLHVAPEPCLEPRLRARLGRGYITADLHDRHTDVRMDIMDIAYPDGTFDFVYCSHVLEHVADDRRAMREFRRVLKKDGRALLLVPIVGGAHTFEDSRITDPKERERVYGQHDHVRSYGADYVDRLKDAGLAVDVVTAKDLASVEDVARMNLGMAAGELYVCRNRTA